MFEMPLCRMSHHVKGIWKIFRVMFYCAAIHRTNSRQCYCKYHRRNMSLVYITFARCRSWILSVPLAFIASIKNLVNHFSSTSINVHDNNNAGKEEEEEKNEQKTNTLQQLQNDREREKNAKELKQWMWSNANAYLFQSQVTIAIFFPLSKQSNVVIIFLLLCLYLCNLISYTHTNTQLTQLINLVLRLICVHDMYSTYLERLHLPRIETVEIEAEAEAEAEKNKVDLFNQPVLSLSRSNSFFVSLPIDIEERRQIHLFRSLFSTGSGWLAINSTKQHIKLTVSREKNSAIFFLLSA